jgi:hypothetical protein
MKITRALRDLFGSHDVLYIGTKVKERVELYLFPPSGLSWPVIG